MFLSLSYFGTDQSQVQRYLSGATLRESRLGLMFNAVLKIPMQFFILLLGALVFVFYQFVTPPVFFNRATWASHATGDAGAGMRAIEAKFDAAHTDQRAKIQDWLGARHGANPEPAKAAMLAAHDRTEVLRMEARQALAAADPRVHKNDSDYVFVTFVLEQMPHGIIGLLIALVFAAAVSSLSSELAALGETTAVHLYRHVLRTDASDLHYVRVSRALTAFWGLIAIGFALFAHLVENLIQAINILGSVFYGVVLGLFLVAFFLRRIGGTAVFWGAVAAQALVFGLYFSLNISYLWFNFIGCAACVCFSLILQAAIGSRRVTAHPATVSS